MKLKTPKVCSCGIIHVRIPKDAKAQFCDLLAGYYWNCACKSTLYVPFKKVRAA